MIKNPGTDPKKCGPKNTLEATVSVFKPEAGEFINIIIFDVIFYNLNYNRDEVIAALLL